ncbi:ArsA family ATPase [Pseudonocardia hispaniensis]|uniref:ArsA family ATPase n=1 Tax=Pseudonocardia hispaniensis TaxID=904933 RepID=A0ABW1IYX6_9PSEU
MRVMLFTGKGGVGKTTLASATAVLLARSGRKTLVVSTDPAHSLGDALEADLDDQPRELAGDAGGLYAAHIDTRVLLDGAWARLQGHLRALLAGAGVDELLADELTVLPGVEELLALTEVRRLAEVGPWEAVVVDCGPTAETLRLLGLPEALSSYLERLFPAHHRAVRGLLAGLAGRRDASESVARLDQAIEALDGLAERLAGLRALLVDPERTSIRLVVTPERVVAAETRRMLTAFALHDIRVDGLVANRVLPAAPPSLRGPAGRWLRERYTEQQAVLAELVDLPGAGPTLRIGEYAAAEPTGVDALLALAQSIYGADDPVAGASPAPPVLSVRRTAGEGTALESEFELAVRLPGAEHGPIELARIGDELAITIGLTRRMVGLPSVLRRCSAVSARLEGAARDTELRVVFRPDPAVWMR